MDESYGQYCAVARSAEVLCERGKVSEYQLTEAGEALRPVVMGLGHWGARWIGGRLRDEELDVGLLMWDRAAS